MEYNILESKSVQKKIKLKNYTLQLVQSLKKVDLDSIYTENFISDAGNTRDDFKKMVDRLESCSKTTIYGVDNVVDVFTGNITQRSKTIEGHSCHIYSLCPVCASNKRAEVMRSIRPHLTALKTLSEKKEVFLYTGCITIQNSVDPVADYEKLRQSWTDFNKMGQLRNTGNHSNGESQKFIGSVLSLEIEANNSKEYHVHGHVLLVCNDKLDYAVYDQEQKRILTKKYGFGSIPVEELKRIELDDGFSKISREWFLVSGAKNIFIEPLVEKVIVSKDGSSKFMDLEKQMFEVVKYSTKPWDIEASEVFVIWDALTNKKRITKSGVFTRRKRFVSMFEALLAKHGLLDAFRANLLEGEVDTVEDGYEVVSRELHGIIYDYELDEYKVGPVPFNQEIKSTPGFKKYLGDRMAFINDYRVKFGKLKKIIPLVRSGKVSAAKWIETKEHMRNKMVEKIFDHSLKLVNYLSSGRKPENPEIWVQTELTLL